MRAPSFRTGAGKQARPKNRQGRKTGKNYDVNLPTRNIFSGLVRGQSGYTQTKGAVIMPNWSHTTVEKRQQEELNQTASAVERLNQQIQELGELVRREKRARMLRLLCMSSFFVLGWFVAELLKSLWRG